VLLDVKPDQSLHRADGVERVQVQPLVLEHHQDSIRELEKVISVRARTRRSSPERTSSSTAPLKFSTPPSTSTVGVPCTRPELSVTTFGTFLREFSPTSSHYRRPPPNVVGDRGSLTVSGSAPVAGFPLRRPPRAHLGYGPSEAAGGVEGWPCAASLSTERESPGKTSLAPPSGHALPGAYLRREITQDNNRCRQITSA